ncbi:MAG: hypothetical protein DDT42_01691 [candidate division WS2 bacterium]|uniref:Uncharacterized protein n=1 Tax=Psychracetigena formicireducens TaxID=2986056 RepID=A0A9E2F1U0_PSYF1|nr:hypothetical protein [Candidatus Psychracetigena formicireducens]
MIKKPYKFNKVKKKKLLELLKSGLRRGAAAKQVGVTPQIVNYHRRNDEEFSRLVDEAEMEANEPVEDALYQAALSGNIIAIQVWLYNRDPDRWSDRRSVRLGGEEGQPIVLKVVYDNENSDKI